MRPHDITAVSAVIGFQTFTMSSIDTDHQSMKASDRMLLLGVGHFGSVEQRTGFNTTSHISRLSLQKYEDKGKDSSQMFVLSSWWRPNTELKPSQHTTLKTFKSKLTLLLTAVVSPGLISVSLLSVLSNPRPPPPSTHQCFLIRLHLEGFPSSSSCGCVLFPLNPLYQTR